jgi:hypothetical protein
LPLTEFPDGQNPSVIDWAAKILEGDDMLTTLK